MKTTKVKPAPIITYAEAARRLGVSVPHLWRVLHGQRVSHRLLARYQRLVGITPRSSRQLVEAA